MVVVPITIGSNIASLSTVRTLAKASGDLSSTYEKLSSGQRINRASDDSAGLSVASSLNIKSKVFAQGIRNINDGVSLMQIAEGALGNLQDIVTRVAELANQAASGTIAPKQRVALDKEANSLLREYNRIVQTTSFNGLQVIDGSNDTVILQHGVGDEQTTRLDIGQQLGLRAGDGTFAAITTLPIVDGSASTGDINNDGIMDIVTGTWMNLDVAYLGNGNGTFRPSQTNLNFSQGDLVLADFTNDGKLDALGVVVTNRLDLVVGNGDGTFQAAISIGVAATSSSWCVGAVDFNNDGNLDLYSSGPYDNLISIRLGNGNGTFKDLQTASGVNQSVGAADFNNDGLMDLYTTTGVFIGNGDGTFKAVFTSARGYIAGDFNGDGNQDIATDSSGQLGLYLGNGDGTFKAILTTGTTGGATHMQKADFNGDGNLDIVTNPRNGYFGIILGNGNGTFSNSITVTKGTDPGPQIAIADFTGDDVIDIIAGTNLFLGNGDANGRRKTVVDPVSLVTIQGARAALDWTKAQNTRISRERGMLGAYDSRLRSALSVLDATRLNSTAAASRITDTDIASESAEMTRLTILQQTGQAILAQANVQPELALRLLRG